MGSQIHQSFLDGADALRSYVNSFEVTGTPPAVKEPSVERDNPSNENSNNDIIETSKYDENSNDNGDAQEEVPEPKKKRFKKDKVPLGLDSANDSDLQATENGNHMEGRKTRSSSRWSSKR